MNHFRRLENIYVSAPVNQYYKPEIRIDKGLCTILQTVNPESFHAANALHGSVLFKLLDDAAFFAANSAVENRFVLTGSFNIKFHKPISSGIIKAKGVLVKHEGRKLWAKSDVKSEDDELLASGDGIFIVSSILLDDL